MTINDLELLMKGKKDKKYGILKQLYYARSISGADLSKKINRSLAHTMLQLNDLVDRGYVHETGLAQSSGGRRPQMYSLKHDIAFIVSVAMDQFVTRIVMFDLHNKSVTEVQKLELRLHDNPRALEELAAGIEAHVRNSGISKHQIAGVGIAMPGFVDVNKGINYSFFEKHSGSITAFISSKTGLDVYIDNDSSLIALAELKFGVARGKRNAMVINVGWGVGLGLVIDGELFRGRSGFAGEFSHIPLFINNKLCSCGKTGCLETEASLTVIVDKARNAIQKGELSLININELNTTNIEQAFESILTAATRGDRFAIELFFETGYNIGRGVAILIHLLNPDAIILSGRGSMAGKIWEPPIQQALNEHCIPKLLENTEIKISELSHQAELIGAAALVMENYKWEISNKSQSGKLKEIKLS